MCVRKVEVSVGCLKRLALSSGCFAKKLTCLGHLVMVQPDEPMLRNRSLV